jgi:ParB-like chromosome segregation protein Spo0J
LTLRFCPEQIEQWPIAQLKPYARNARTHSDDQIARIAASLIEYGFTSPLLIADDGTVIAGHGRLLAAQRLELTDVPVIRLAHLSDAQARAYRLCGAPHKR